MIELNTPTRADDIALMHRVCAILEHCKQCPSNQTSSPSKTTDHITHCGSCNYFKELRAKGGTLWGEDVPRKARQLLQKDRDDLTRDELQYLFDSGVPKERIAVAYGFKKASTSPFKVFVQKLGAIEPKGKPAKI